ncbi:MAG TPA: MBL fold metallo-hydrolase [Archangium sp.]|uniref:MBL fold metallo-hydrolase n=1 Tax=Archangium sp. TaxID=1872627 RepID=UPI002E345382|nr:MBL fold metallo-hydrolase [Archangium sp.]HEX5751290.1 MBL fold metallo-hydrolase [Archangium sp.]
MIPDGTRVPKPPQPIPERILPSHLAPQSLSVVVFGPGHGEAIVVVLPDGTVGVVDGCREPTVLDPVREFLEELSREPGRQGQPLRLGFVCMTHPHEDHYRGLGRLLEAFRGRVERVWRTPDVGDRYVRSWLQFLKHTQKDRRLTPEPDDVEGLARIMAEMRLATQEHGAKFLQLQHRMQLMEGVMEGHPIRILGCGPASRDLDTAQITLLGVLKGLKRGRKPGHFDPNAASGALLIEWGQARVLLAGDLLCRKGSFQGWEEVCDDIPGPVQVIKAAHHASLGAHHDALWTRLQPTLAIVTPFLHAKGRQPPRPKQITRLSRDSVVAITSEPRWRRASTHPRPVFGTSRMRRGADPQVTTGGFANNAMSQVPTGGEADARNAVAVSLDATGKLLRFVLAGRADVYEPSAGTYGTP